MRAIIVGSLAAATLAVLAMPAQAAEYRIQSKEDPRLCLTEGTWNGLTGGDVHVTWCDPYFGRSSQHWWSWDGGWTRNVGSHHCLQADQFLFDPDSVRTQWCSATHWQYWWHWNGGWKQRQPGGPFPAACLSRVNDPNNWTEVTIVRCLNPYGPNHPREEWWLQWVPGT